MSSRTVSEWEHVTAVVDGPATTGTGFFLRDVQGLQLYLVTCKHLIGESLADRVAAQQITLHINQYGPNGNLQPIAFQAPLQDGAGQPRWREHPEEHVDVIVVRVTGLALQQGLALVAKPLDIIATPDALTQLEVRIGDAVAIVGYPNRKRQAGNNLPLFRYAHISSPVFSTVSALYPGQAQPSTVRGFWIDGLMVPGSSGSPVVLVSERLISQGDATVVVASRPLLLGVIAKAEYSVIPPGNSPAYAGLSVVHHSQTVAEVIALF